MLGTDNCKIRYDMLLYLYKEEFRFPYKAVAFVPCKMRPQLCRWVWPVTGVEEAGVPVTHDDH